MAKGSVYAVARGRSLGLHTTWEACLQAVKWFPGARFKAFPATNTSAAMKYLQENNVHEYDTHESYALELLQRQLRAVSSAREQPSVTESATPVGVATPLAHGQKRKAPEVDVSGPSDSTVAYTDGSCVPCPVAPDKCVAGAGVWFGSSDPRNQSCSVPGKQTSNRAELYAIVKALGACDDAEKVVIRSDSTYAIGVARRELKLTANEDLTRLLTRTIERFRYPVSFEKVKAHIGIEGNEEADKLAYAAAERRRVWFEQQKSGAELGTDS